MCDNFRVLIIGADHHNTLAVLRCIARGKLDYFLLIHGKENVKDVGLAYSKYAKGKIATVEEEAQALFDKTKEYRQDGVKTVLFPCSDFAEYVIDRQAAVLLDMNFVIPGFKDKPGYVAELMDKYEQKLFAVHHKIKMAKTWKTDLTQETVALPSDLVFPCIVKPEISAEGRKSDIQIVEGMDDLQHSLQGFQEKNYRTVIIQQFLKKKFEVCAYGAILDQSPHFCGGIIRKLNEYPPQGGGSLSYAQFIHDEEITAFIHRVLGILYEEGYRGLYDIELLVCSDAIYLNEINFRHSGNGYALLKNRVYAPLYWCLDSVGVQLPKDSVFWVENSSTHMDEMLELQLFRDHGISFNTFIRSIVSAKAYAKWDVRDNRVFFAYFRPYLKALQSKIFGRFSRNHH